MKVKKKMEIIVNIDYLSRMLLKQVVIALNNFSVVVIIFMYYTKKKPNKKQLKLFLSVSMESLPWLIYYIARNEVSS